MNHEWRVEDREWQTRQSWLLTEGLFDWTKTRSGGVPTKVECNYICHNLSGFTTRISASWSWYHRVVNKHHFKSESGFLKTKSGSSFNPDVGINRFCPYEFNQNVMVLVSLTFYCQVVVCDLLKQIARSFHWYLPIVVRHLESNESGSGTGLMVSPIRIQLQKIWPRQMQRILNPVSVWVKSNRAWKSRFWLADLPLALAIEAMPELTKPTGHESIEKDIRNVSRMF